MDPFWPKLPGTPELYQGPQNPTRDPRTLPPYRATAPSLSGYSPRPFIGSKLSWPPHTPHPFCLPTPPHPTPPACEVGPPLPPPLHTRTLCPAPDLSDLGLHVKLDPGRMRGSTLLRRVSNFNGAADRCGPVMVLWTGVGRSRRAIACLTPPAGHLSVAVLATFFGRADFFKNMQQTSGAVESASCWATVTTTPHHKP